MLTIEQCPIDTLVPYKNNSKKHSKEQISEIVASIREFGNCDPIAVWTRPDGLLEVVEGHGRLEALKILNETIIPVIKLDFLSDAQRRAYSHVHNQITLESGLDEEVVKKEIAELSGFDWANMGFDVVIDDLDEALSGEDVSLPDEHSTIPEIAGLGDVFKTSKGHIIICGDSTLESTYQMISEFFGSPDLLLTDPPYGVDITGGTIDQLKIKNDDLPPEELMGFLYQAFKNSESVMREGCPFYIWCPSGKLQSIFIQALQKTIYDVRQVLVWKKNVFTLGRSDYQYQHEPCLYGWTPGKKHYFTRKRNKPTILSHPEKLSREELLTAYRELSEFALNGTIIEAKKPSASRLHPTTKPIKLFEELIINSTKRGNKVLDIFAGSGTTLLACENLDRIACVVEYDPHYVDVILWRYEQLTGEYPERIRNGSEE